MKTIFAAAALAAILCSPVQANESLEWQPFTAGGGDHFLIKIVHVRGTHLGLPGATIYLRQPEGKPPYGNLTATMEFDCAGGIMTLGVDKHMTKIEAGSNGEDLEKMACSSTKLTASATDKAASAQSTEMPKTQTIAGANGVSYVLNLRSIVRKRTMDHSDLPTGAKILVYRDDGNPPNDQAFYTIVFDCGGRYMLWNHPEEAGTINPRSILSRVEDAACWGPVDRSAAQ